MITAQPTPGGSLRLKTQEEFSTHQETGEKEYIKLKICPSSYDEYRMLASFVQKFLKKFNIVEVNFESPDEWSQYLTIEFTNNSQDRQATINLINNLGFWACLDGEIGVVDLADIDLNLLKLVFPTISFKTEPIQQKFSESVTPQHFNIEMLNGNVSHQNGVEKIKETKEKKPREKVLEKVPPVLEEPKQEVVPETNGHNVLSFEELVKTDIPLPSSFKTRNGQGTANLKKWPLGKTFWNWGKSQNSDNLAAGIKNDTLALHNEKTRAAFNDVMPQEHRRELFRTIEGVEYWNDSRATNINSVWFTLETIEKPIIWIAGGADKGNDYEPILELVKKKVIFLICLGKDTRSFRKAFQDIVPEMVEVTLMDQAVQVAYHKAKSGDTVLLSPGCASFDLFENYEDRGRQFKQAVWSL